MSVSTTSALHFLSLTPKTLLYSNLSSSTFDSVSFFPKLFTTSLSLSSPTKISTSWRFKVAVSSDFGLDEDTVSSDLDDDDDDRSFSPDLKLFVGNLPFTCDSAVLADLFGSAGTVEMVEVIYDKFTGRSRGFAFVTMSTAEEVDAAVEQFNGYEVEGRALRVNSGPPPPKEENSFRAPRGGQGGGRSFGGQGGERSFGGQGGGRSFAGQGGERSFGGQGGGRSFGNTNRLYVGNLSWNVDDVALETLFSEQGKVVEAKVVYDRDSRRSRGFGFVTYSSSNEVNRAIDNLNGADLDGRSIRVSVAEAPPPRRQY